MLILLIVIIALQVVAIMRCRPLKPAAPVAPASLDTQVALASAMATVGLNVEDYHLDYDIKSTSKMGDVLYHAALELGIPANSLGDLHNMLSEAKH